MRKELKVFVFWPILKPTGAIADGISMLDLEWLLQGPEGPF